MNNDERLTIKLQNLFKLIKPSLIIVFNSGSTLSHKRVKFSYEM